MNTSNHQKSPCHALVSFLWSICLTGLALCAALAVLLAVCFPGKNGPLQLIAMDLGLIRPLAGVTSHVPKGQLQADARTLVASLRWLLEPNWDAPITVSNKAVTGVSNTNAPAVS